jgi:hypothetical protein
VVGAKAIERDSGNISESSEVSDEEKWMKWQFQFNYEWIIVAAEAHEQESELGLGAQNKTKEFSLWRIDVWVEDPIYV